MRRPVGAIVALCVAGGCIAALLAVLVPPPADAEEAARTTQQAAADYYCPDCRGPVRYDQDRCPACGAEFEPLRPRTKKGEAPPGEAARPRDESPFEKREPAEKGAGSIISEPWAQIRPPEESRFGFASYGRAGITSDWELSAPKPHDIVDFRPRIEKGPYQELYFFYKDVLGSLPIRVQTTLSFEEQLFHYTGKFDAQFALRELYAEVNPTPRIALWIGSRMYRGDDIYLLDFWPLDDQNTLGGGAAVRLGEHHTIQVHAGFNRIVDDKVFYQFQEIDIPVPVGIGTQKVVFLDRNRFVGSATYRLELAAGFKWKVHAEGHYIPSGERRESNQTVTELPQDWGFLAGTEVGFFGHGSFANLFFKYARGLGAYDELQIPYGFNTDLEITKAWRVLGGVGAALDLDFMAVHFGGYFQHFEDADEIDDQDDNDQFALAVRPEFFLGNFFRLGAEASLQGFMPEGIYAQTGEEETGLVASFHLFLGVGAGKGPFARPELLFFLGWHFLDSGARLELERRFGRSVDSREDVFGLLAEWWF